MIAFDAPARTLKLERSGEIGENASFSDFNNEALFRAHNLGDEALEHEKARYPRKYPRQSLVLNNVAGNAYGELRDRTVSYIEDYVCDEAEPPIPKSYLKDNKSIEAALENRKIVAISGYQKLTDGFLEYDYFMRQKPDGEEKRISPIMRLVITETRSDRHFANLDLSDDYFFFSNAIRALGRGFERKK
ncbi:MAG: hypothetical protein LBG19_12905 [Prevotellaceae bacterium]|jgi:hypothetical protein|nr:hypothetical protein [Prevotellaceae bacterium]